MHAHQQTRVQSSQVPPTEPSQESLHRKFHFVDRIPVTELDGCYLALENECGNINRFFFFFFLNFRTTR